MTYFKELSQAIVEPKSLESVCYSLDLKCSPQISCVEGLVFRVVLLEGSAISVGHWRYAFKGECGTPVSSSLFPGS